MIIYFSDYLVQSVRLSLFCLVCFIKYWEQIGVAPIFIYKFHCLMWQWQSDKLACLLPFVHKVSVDDVAVGKISYIYKVDPTYIVCKSENIYRQLCISIIARVEQNPIDVLFA